MRTDQLAAAPAVAAFDLDGTLTDGGSVVHWLTAIRGRRTVRGATLRHLPALALGALRSGTAADHAKESLFCSVLDGCVAADVAELSSQFAVDHLRAHTRPTILDRLVQHLDAGHAVVVVSASPTIYVAPIAASLGAHGCASTDLEVHDGRLTGRYDGANCRGAEKLRKVRSVLAELGVPETGPDRPLYAYGNSRGDLRLLAAADRPVDVSRLGKLGRLRRYPRIGTVAVS